VLFNENLTVKTGKAVFRVTAYHRAGTDLPKRRTIEEKRLFRRQKLNARSMTVSPGDDLERQRLFGWGAYTPRYTSFQVQ
jgi:hypothetical protein